jgi:hypothetical protein
MPDKIYEFSGNSFFECKNEMEKWMKSVIVKITFGEIILKSVHIDRKPDKDEFYLSIKYYES